jgi:hypothetical protein
MKQAHRLMVAGLVLAAGLLFAAPAHAGLAGWFCCPDGREVHTYSPFNYWTPTMRRAAADLCGRRISVYAPDSHPEIVKSFTVLRYSRCFPAPVPAETLIPLPTPPPESKAR